MPTTYEPLDVNTDTTTTKTILHEVIPLTGTIVSGTYDSPDGTSFNIKNYTKIVTNWLSEHCDNGF